MCDFHFVEGAAKVSPFYKSTTALSFRYFFRPWWRLVTSKQPNIRRRLSQIGQRFQISRIASSDSKLDQESILPGMARHRPRMDRCKIQPLPCEARQGFDQS